MYKVIFCVIKQDICLRALFSQVDHLSSSEAALEEYSSDYLHHWCKCFPARGQKFKLLRKCSPQLVLPQAPVMQQIDQLVLRDIYSFTFCAVVQILVVHLYCVKSIRVIPLSNKWKLLLLFCLPKQCTLITITTRGFKLNFVWNITNYAKCKTF